MSATARLLIFSAIVVCSSPAGADDSLQRLPSTTDGDAEVLPLDAPSEETVIETEWIVAPWDWPVIGWDTSPWKSSYEIGIDGSEGNSQTLSFRAGANWKREVERSKFEADLKYLKATADSIETKNNALLGMEYEWLFLESPWTLFVKSGLEYDEFKAFDIRVTVNGGVGYRHIDTDTVSLTSRFGAGVSHEIGGPDDRWVAEAVFGSDYEHQITKRQKVAIKAEYFPEWADFTDFRLVTEASWQVLLDEASNLSLKVGVVDRYDSTPNGREPNDLDYALLLLWEK